MRRTLYFVRQVSSAVSKAAVQTVVSITKGVITLLKKGGRHVWEELNNYRPITLLNTELKILVQVLENHLQLVISDLIEPEQNYAVKGRFRK